MIGIQIMVEEIKDEIRASCLNNLQKYTCNGFRNSVFS
jgi:hypothetical protein